LARTMMRPEGIVRREGKKEVVSRVSDKSAS